ncbi:hypothetical protein M422DRAFT_179123 [Sphaerobolus stellatus SS14]|uniref:Cation/H+ exchanger transmembrane domain-containing protein n=1 Tax=Sphaerobolus stellatus (strain SS14) TaxID=990650 RepID=A0A0C9U1J4_SPHS4|nr:hypothetical protein M422DRAFT_179123 [Sphaerobolus stellatus SS14]
MPVFSETIVEVARGGWNYFTRRTAPDQGGLLSGKDPTAYNPADPLRIWIIQVGVIMLTTQLLSLLLKKLRQPRVIAEVLGGILLGPTAFGRIPGFTNHIFPGDSIPFLTLVANIGLVLFLFLVGLEIDGTVIKKNAKLSASIALGGMSVPFGLGVGYSVAIYKEFVDQSIPFSHFMLFVGVAFSITAFPVLCRILTELKLLDTTVGVVVLSAGVANDIVGWILLALTVALVNAASGLTALWILMICVGWTFFLLFPVKRVFLWLAHKTGSIENGPSLFFMTVTMLMTFGSAFFTDVIGVHAIFGGFLAGLVIPREGGLAIALTEKLEDMVSIVFLPLYFTLSGLSTDLGLLNTGLIWAYVVGIVGLAYVGKFGGCIIAARLSGFQWRESATIGTLMSCKGLVELIVLNVGLAAGILDRLVFSMFVLEALLLTFMTTPVVVQLYPPELRKRASQAATYHEGHDEKNSRQSLSSLEDDKHDAWKTRFTVVLDKMEHLPSIMTVSQLFRPAPASASVTFVDSDATKPGAKHGKGTESSIGSSQTSRAPFVAPPVIDALRLIELSDRTSAVMKSSVADTLIHTDPLLNVFRTFSELNDISVSTSLSVVPFDGLASKVAEHAHDMLSHLVIVPWLPHAMTMTHPHPVSDHSTNTATPTTTTPTPHNNPFDILFHFGLSEQSSSALHSHFVRGIFARSTVDVALYVDRGRVGSGHFSKQHIFLPFFGGPDDRLAMELTVQLCSKPWISAKMMRVTKTEFSPPAPKSMEAAHTKDTDGQGEAFHSIFQEHSTVSSAFSLVHGFPDTIYGAATTQTRIQSETADNITWSKFASPSDPSTLSVAEREALSRIQFVKTNSATPLRDILAEAEAETNVAVQKKARPFVMLGRARRLAAESHSDELKSLFEENGTHINGEVRKTMGDVATAFVLSGGNAGLLVIQTARKVSED